VTPFRTTITNPTGIKTVQLGNPLTIRVKIDDRSANRCPDLVLTVARGSEIVGSSETNLRDSAGNHSVFSSVSGNVCQTNFIVADELTPPELPGQTDFDLGQLYKFCVNFRTQQPGGPAPTGQPFGTSCGQFQTASP
jgi:hypothetical protein